MCSNMQSSLFNTKMNKIKIKLAELHSQIRISVDFIFSYEIKYSDTLKMIKLHFRTLLTGSPCCWKHFDLKEMQDLHELRAKSR